MKNYDFDLTRYFFQPIISIVLPYFFILSYDRLINSLFYFNIPFLFVLPIIFTGIIEVIFGIYFSRKYSDVFIRFRELIFVLIGYAVIYYPLLHKRIFFIAYILLLVFMQWMFSFLIQSNLFSRELLFDEIKGKKGVSLSIALRNSGYISKGSFLGLKNIKELITFFQVVIFFILIIYLLSGIKLSLLTNIIIFFNFLMTLITISIINFYLYEQNLAFKGFLFSEEEKNEKFSFILIFILVSLLGSFLFANFNFFKYEDLVYILDFLSRFFPKFKDTYNLLKEDKVQEILTPEAKEEIITKITQSIPFFKIWSIIVLVTIIIVFSSFTILLLLFLFRPFFQRFNINFESILSLIKNFYMFLIILFKKVVNFFKNFFSSTKEWFYKGEREIVIKKSKTQRIKRKQQKVLLKKKKVLNKVLKLFSILIKKAKKHGCPYYYNFTALEYIENLLKALDLKEKQIAREFYLVGAIFDKAYFSKEYITKQEFVLYKKTVKNIIKKYY